MFVINKHDEETAKVYLKRLKKPFTKFMPVQYEGNIYNARVLQNAYKKLMKRGNGVLIKKIGLSCGVISIHYKTETGEGFYEFLPLVSWNGYAPHVTTDHPVEII